MIEPTVVVLLLVAVIVGVVVVFARRKPSATNDVGQDGDTGWNDPISPGESAVRPTNDTLAPTADDAVAPSPAARDEGRPL